MVVVLGASAALLQSELADLPVQLIENQQWPEGIGSSIRAGIGSLCALQDAAAQEAVVIAVCDQPYFSAAVVRRLIDAYWESGGLVASRYGDVLGVPALFPRVLCPLLLELRGDQGARGLIRVHAEALRSVPFPEGAIDIDTAADSDLLEQS